MCPRDRRSAVRKHFYVVADDEARFLDEDLWCSYLIVGKRSLLETNGYSVFVRRSLVNRGAIHGPITVHLKAKTTMYAGATNG
jgi:hypothetical protein